MRELLPLQSILISQIVGLYLIVMAIIMIARADYYRPLMQRLNMDKAYVTVSSASLLLLGVFLIAVHNIWVLDTEVIVTIVAWLITIKAVLWLSFPENMAAIANRLYEGNSYYIMLGIMALIGIILTAHGYHFFSRGFTPNIY